MLIQRVGDVAKKAFSNLNKLQQKEKLLVKTGEEMFDCHLGGLLPKDVVVLAGAPSTGKSETLYRMLDNMLSKELNPDADKYVSLEYSMEMAMLNKLLRATHNILHKKKSDILFNPFTEEEKKLVRTYNESLQDDRRYVVEKPVTPLEFYNETRAFCEAHRDKEAILISADHLLLFTGSDKQAVLEQVVEYVNLLKLEFDNVYFFLLSQLNRSYSSIIKDKSNEMIPTNAQLFGSSFMEQIASYIAIITNPFKLNVNQYLSVNEDRYDYLRPFFGEKGKNNKTSFETLGNLFYFVTKTRESDNPWKDLFIKAMDLTEEQLQKLKVEKENTLETIPSLTKEEISYQRGTDIPKFNLENLDDIFNK